jgi:hypothetical protein
MDHLSLRVNSSGGDYCEREYLNVRGIYYAIYVVFRQLYGQFNVPHLSWGGSWGLVLTIK